MSRPDHQTDDPADNLKGEALGLRAMVLEHLRDQGFTVDGGKILAPVRREKDHFRLLHAQAVAHARQVARGALERHESGFIRRLARGADIDPGIIQPRLIPVDGHKSRDALMWRWCSLHWSIPVSRGYGRRLRFLIVDAGHKNAVMGLIGLADPVFALRTRDEWVGWDNNQRAEGLCHVMEAFALGAVPPYSTLCGAKLAALLATSTEVRDTFRHRYGHRKTLIGQRQRDAHLVLISTHSALGRSSVYNRLYRKKDELAYRPVGYTTGSGDFHLSGDVYERLAKFARQSAEGSFGRHERWTGKGFRNKREVLHLAFTQLGLAPRGLRLHGIQRQSFVAPLARNSAAWLRGEESTLEWWDEPVDVLATWWRNRWAVPRAARVDDWQKFEPEQWAIYGS